jgi:hypothetical protein
MFRGSLYFVALLAFPLACGAGPARAQTTPPDSATTPPVAKPGSGTQQTVIAPPSTGDRAIVKGAPPPEHYPTPVIRPRASPKDAPSVPKSE